MNTKSNKIIFVVDDEPIIANTLAIILEQHDVNAMPFYSADVALRAAEITPPHLLISDVAMPAMTGIELAISLRMFYPDCRILLFSGQANTADLLRKAQALGHNFDILSKPIYPVDLLSSIRHLHPTLLTH